MNNWWIFPTFHPQLSGRMRLATVVSQASLREMQSRKAGTSPFNHAWEAALREVSLPTFQAHKPCRLELAQRRPLRPREILDLVESIQEWNGNAPRKTLETKRSGWWKILHTFFMRSVLLKHPILRIPKPPWPLGWWSVSLAFQWILFWLESHQKNRIIMASNLFTTVAGMAKTKYKVVTLM